MPSEQPPTRVHECPTCGSPVEVVSSDEGTHHYRPAPSEQPREGTRCREIASIEARCMRPEGHDGEHSYRQKSNRPAQPQPRGEGDDLAARLEDLASWLEPDSPFHGTIREAAQLARASTHPEQSERIVGAALDLLDSLGAPHYHDLIGMTYTLRKEQADNLRAALEPASPTPTEQEDD